MSSLGLTPKEGKQKRSQSANDISKAPEPPTPTIEKAPTEIVERPGKQFQNICPIVVS